jgi:hypothetical protein
MIDVAAMDPVSSLLPSAVTHTPTIRALAVAERVLVYVVLALVLTTSVVGAAEVPVPVGRRTLLMLKPPAFTAMTFPKAPRPPNPPPNPVPAPGPRVRPGSGTPGAPVGPPGAPGGRPPRARVAPLSEQVPFTAAEISTLAATTGLPVGRGAAVGAAPPAAEAGRTARTWTHTPTTRPERLMATVLVKVVLAE